MLLACAPAVAIVTGSVSDTRDDSVVPPVAVGAGSAVAPDPVPATQGASSGASMSSLRWLAACLVLGIAFVVGVMWAGEPMWESNDDIQMSMRAHGYGAAAVGSERLVYSNVLWGRLVRAMPEIGGYLGYTVTSVLVMGLIAGLIAYLLCAAGVRRTIALGVAALVIAPIALTPQFTIVAGLCTALAVVAAAVWGRARLVHLLAIAVLMAWVGFLVRPNMVPLVLLVGAPLLPWRALARSRAGWIAVLAFALLVGGSRAVNERAYSSDEWRAFTRLNDARRPYTDFGLARYVRESRPDVATDNGLSVVEIELLESWFFPDPEVWSAKRLEGMRADLDSQARIGRVSLRRAVRTSMSFSRPGMIVPTLLAAFVLMLALQPRGWRVRIMWGICAVVVFGFALLGRPGITRVYLPLATLLLMAPLVAGAAAGARGLVWPRGRALRVLVVLALGLAVAVEGLAVAAEQVRARSDVRDAAAAMEKVERLDVARDDVLVTWGARASFRRLHPVLQRRADIPRVRYYALGLATHAPTSVSAHEFAAGRGVLERLTSDGGVNVLWRVRNDGIVARGNEVNILERLCHERWDAALEEDEVLDAGLLSVRRLRCLPDSWDGVSTRRG